MRVESRTTRTIVGVRIRAKPSWSGIVTGQADKVDKSDTRDEPEEFTDRSVINDWVLALERRHLADLRVSEVTRALRALSSAYVERRHGSGVPTGQQKVRGTLDSAGKRAAFALFYAPLHFIAVERIVTTLGAHRPGPRLSTKFGCGTGLCGACTIHIDGKRAFSCQVPVEQAAGQRITTVEGLDGSRLGRTVKRAWLDEAVPQCGYCQSGQIVSAVDLLSNVKNPTRDQIRAHMSSNLCRCGTYERIVRAVARASKTA